MPNHRKTRAEAATDAAAAIAAASVDNALQQRQLSGEESRKAARKLALLQGIAAQVELMQNQNDDQDGN